MAESASEAAVGGAYAELRRGRGIGSLVGF